MTCSASSVDDSVECKHGPMECLGNMIELCAADLYPDPKIYLGFTMCLTREYERIPQRTLVEDCALEHGIDFGKLNGCISRDDAYAAGLLKNSVRRSADAGVEISCTVRGRCLLPSSPSFVTSLSFLFTPVKHVISLFSLSNAANHRPLSL